DVRRRSSKSAEAGATAVVSRVARASVIGADRRDGMAVLGRGAPFDGTKLFAPRPFRAGSGWRGRGTASKQKPPGRPRRPSGRVARKSVGGRKMRAGRNPARGVYQLNTRNSAA